MLIICLMLLLCWVAYEDFKFRAVSWWIFPLILSAAMYYPASIHVAWHQFLMNLGLVLLMTLMLMLYVYIKLGTLKHFFAQMIGAADIFLWVVLTPLLPVMLFVMLYTVSLLFALAAHGLLKRFTFYGEKSSVPLAGLQAIFFAIMISVPV